LSMSKFFHRHASSPSSSAYYTKQEEQHLIIYESLPVYDSDSENSLQCSAIALRYLYPYYYYQLCVFFVCHVTFATKYNFTARQSMHSIYLLLLYCNVFHMSVGCKGVCQRFRNIGGGKHSVYELGFKRCSECGIYIKFAGPRCPCCKLPLRSKMRNYTKTHNSNGGHYNKNIEPGSPS